MVGSSQKGLVLQPRCHERNLSVEKIQFKYLRYLFCPRLREAFSPSLGWEVRACMCVAVLSGGTLLHRHLWVCSSPLIVLTTNLSPIYNSKH